MYSPTISTTLSANAGALLILNVFSRCGRKSAAFQIWRTCHGVTSAYRAINSMLQCVASSGIRFVVRNMTLSTVFLSMTVGRPERGRSSRPLIPSASNRFRHRCTVFAVLVCAVATSVGVTPSLSCRMIFCAHDLTVRQRRGSTPLIQSCATFLGIRSDLAGRIPSDRHNLY